MFIYNYIDYRDFLRNYIKNLPFSGRGELNRMALAIGVHPSLLSQVLAEVKNLSFEQGELIGGYIGLSENELDYLISMIGLQRAGTPTLRDYYMKKIRNAQKIATDLNQQILQERKLTEEEKSIFYSHWHYAGIWLFTALGKGVTIEQVTLKFRIQRERAIRIVNFLVETHLCTVNEGIFKMGPQSFHLERTSPFLNKHHTSWRLQAIENSERINEDELIFTAPISLSKSDFKLLHSKLIVFIKEFTSTVNSSESEEIGCLNIDFFRIT